MTLYEIVINMIRVRVRVRGLGLGLCVREMLGLGLVYHYRLINVIYYNINVLNH